MKHQIGSVEYEKMIEYMRADIESGMMYTKIEMKARELLKQEGKDFDLEFKKFMEKNKK